MIEQFPISKRNEYYYLLEFLNDNYDPDFYFVKNNTRIFINDVKNLRELIKTSNYVYCQKEKGLYTGIILVRRSKKDLDDRYYVKLIAKDAKTAKDLLTILTWNSTSALYAKVRLNNKFMNVFKNKGFRYFNSLGSQVIFKRDHIDYGRIMRKEGDD